MQAYLEPRKSQSPGNILESRAHGVQREEKNCNGMIFYFFFIFVFLSTPGRHGGEAEMAKMQQEVRSLAEGGEKRGRRYPRRSCWRL